MLVSTWPQAFVLVVALVCGTFLAFIVIGGLIWGRKS